ncbi:MAG: D-amino acid dehydrogenase [Planctomycetes bacterium]|nr:D-amino acid dehydrogenase [Planctomycetota bacterium]
MRVLVVGAGVIGLTTAYLLQREGVAVTVVDREPTAGAGASSVNGAQLSYSYVAPLADPAVLGKLASLLFDADSPLKFRPRLEPAQWAWGLAFLGACDRDRSRATTRALLGLSFLSRDVIERIVADERIECAFTRGGKLVVYPDAASVAHAREQLEFQAQLGCRQELLTREQCVAREPALAGYAERIAGGVWTRGEAAADCGAFCTALAELLVARGATLRLGETVLAIEAGDDGARVVTRSGKLDAERVVLANGSRAAELGRTAGLRLPVYPLKGYAVTLRQREPAFALRGSITDTRRKIVFAPLGERVRVAGFVELAGHDASLPQARIDALLRAAREVIGVEAHGDVQPWCGFRPSTPTSLPIVGASPRRSLVLNVGHGMLGWTLAGGSARLVVDTLLGREPPIDASAFAYGAV